MNLRSWFLRLATASLAAVAARADASVGLLQIGPTAEDGPVTVYYPSSSAAAPVQRGPFTLTVAVRGVPVAGNGHLVVISHGSGGAPWVHADLARALVEAGFVVAMPEHRKDNYKDDSVPGPESWKLRPAEVSRAIDSVTTDPRFAALLRPDGVGVYGMSAGGHTALTLAGGRWSPAGFRDHCDAHLADDFQFCVGLITHLTGSPFDAVRLWAARTVIDHRFGDATPQSYTDPRVAAAVAGVPAAADFEMASLEHPVVPLGLVTADHDTWLVPRFHGDRVLAACLPVCERIATIAGGGHGALLSPHPPGLTGLVGDLLNDPPGFDRGTLPAVDLKIVAFFERHLLR